MTPENAATAHRRPLLLALFLITFCTYGAFFNGGGWNQNAHFALTRAIVEQQTVRIDSYRWATFDVSEHDGHVYANKAPGLSLMAVPVYAALHALVDPEQQRTVAFMTLAAWICTLAVCALPGGLLVAAIAHHLMRVGIAPSTATAVSLTTGFGSMLFPFSSMLFLHTASALFLFVAWDLVVRHRRPLLAGVAAGMSGFFNYLCIPLAAGILILHGLRSRNRRAILLFSVGAIGPALALAAYQHAAFGNPFTTTLDTLPAHFIDEGAVGGILRLPSPAALLHLTISPYRGLLFSMPILAWGIWGAVRRRSSDAITALILTAILILANASFNGWHAGSSYGPRYLIPIIPLLMVYSAYVWDAAILVRRAAVGWSLFVAALAAAVNPMVSPDVPNPLTDYLVPLFFSGRFSSRIADLPPDSWKSMAGHVSVNEQTILEVTPWMIAPRESPEAYWASFNLAELLLPGSPWSAAAILAISALAVLASYRHAQRIPK